MADKVKILEEGRYVMATFPDCSDITSCTFYYKKPHSMTEYSLSTSFAVDTVDGEVVSGYRFGPIGYSTATGFNVPGQYIFEPYIEMSDGYKGRREAFKLTVYNKYK